MPAAVAGISEPLPASCSWRQVAQILPVGLKTQLVFDDGTSLAVSRFMGGFAKISDRIAHDALADDPAREILVAQAAGHRTNYLYLAPIGYVTQPRLDKRQDYFLRAHVAEGRLGIKQLHLPNTTVRDYFYFGNRKRAGCEEQTLYDLLRVDPRATIADLRLALKVRLLELETISSPRDQVQPVERAFNLLAHPEWRSCYDGLLRDAEAPALFPYGGFGSILVAGDRSADHETFFVRRILSFLPEHRERRFRALLRQVEFLDGYAVYRDCRRKVEVLLDSLLLSLPFDPTWNQWRHLAGTKFGIEASFVQSGKYELRAGEWHLRKWETALPSRVKINLPGDTMVKLAEAQRMYRRFGQFYDELASIRDRIEREPIERTELARICDRLHLPPDFDIAQVSWKADYDRFYYEQLLKRSRKVFLFRNEFVFELERAVAVEIPQQGHATYVFARPSDLDSWVRAYAGTTREDIRHNKGNAAEHLGFIGRVNHGRSPRRWLRDLRQRLGERVDCALTEETEGQNEDSCR